MALEELKAQLAMLINEINSQPEDIHELYERVHQLLNEYRVTGQALPRDLVEFEQRALKDYPPK